ncbi:protein asteroid homolog 1 [Megalops cyprinoides]|uniref:protein asteroid homolog 1 n=1 Tax=Megalops cyprinoides TaxID=118141 RepID=UPI001864BD50|nr:protein asteroid homolog 1 [Megalops cyprinoides]
MGVQGLTSYVEGNRQFFKELKLRNTTLVIDGCSLYFRLYFTSGLDQQHGGDYDSFADLVRQFFDALSVCDIRAVVVLDGGIDYTDKKFATLKQRAQSKIKEAHALSRGGHGSVLPLLTREVFKQVLTSLQVPFIQCVSEADWEIASLANQWNCAVLTMDSDFYIFDLKGGYFPFTFFNWQNVGVCKGSSERYIPAWRFSVNKFCAHFNHMNKELLPLFAVIAGNDYTNLRAMETFFSRVHFPPSARPAHGRTQARIDGLLHWLAQFPGPEEALDEVLRVVGSGPRGPIRNLLSSGMREYRLSGSSLARFFTDGAALSAAVDLPEPVRALPDWLLQALSRGQLPSLVIDVLVLQRALLIVQVENCRLPSSHAASLPLRQVLYGLLLEGRPKTHLGPAGRGPGRSGRPANPADSGSARCVQEFDRHDLDLRQSSVQTALPRSPQQLSLETLNKVPLPARLQVLLESLGVDERAAGAVPPHLSLPACVTCFWLSSCKPKPALQLLQALLLWIVFGELCRLRGGQRGAAGPAAGHPDMRAVYDRLSKLRVNKGERKGLDLEVAHAYSQWQSCMWMGFYLNQLLCCPLPEPECAWLYSGTFVHRAVREMRAGSNPEALLAGPPLPGRLYNDILGAVVSCVGVDFFSAPAKKNRRGRRPAQQGRGRRKGSGATPSHRTPPTQDMVNRFGLLVCEDEDEEEDEEE